MGFRNENRTSKYFKIQKTYSEHELKELNDELEKFRITKEISFPEKRTISFIDEWAWMKDKGALTKDGEVVITGMEKIKCGPKSDDYYWDCEPIMYETLIDKLSQWTKWKFKENAITNNYLDMANDLENKFRISGKNF